MKMIMRTIFIIWTIGLLSNPVLAQNSTRIVTISGGTVGGDFEAQVTSALKARIAATTRYTIGSVKESELEVSVTCFDISTIAHDVTGGVCSLVIFYWPHELEGL